MIERSPQNHCARHTELIAYLYDETSQAEKAVFETHLANCAHCADEVAGFSLMRGSIGEWRARVFEPLATPVIELPLPNKIVQPPSADSKSVIRQIRAFFAFSPARGGAALAALVICVGLALLALNSRRAEQQPPLARTNEAPTSEKNTTVEAAVAPSADIAQLEAEISKMPKRTSPVNEPPKPSADQPASNAKNEAARLKAATPIAKNRELNVRKAAPRPALAVKPAKKSNQASSPASLADDEEYEDDALRLSDIFSETEMR